MTLFLASLVPATVVVLLLCAYAVERSERRGRVAGQVELAKARHPSRAGRRAVAAARAAADAESCLWCDEPQPGAGPHCVTVTTISDDVLRGDL